jgi:hypothetical protein
MQEHAWRTGAQRTRSGAFGVLAQRGGVHSPRASASSDCGEATGRSKRLELATFAVTASRLQERAKKKWPTREFSASVVGNRSGLGMRGFSAASNITVQDRVEFVRPDRFAKVAIHARR